MYNAESLTLLAALGIRAFAILTLHPLGVVDQLVVFRAVVGVAVDHCRFKRETLARDTGFIR